MIKNHHQWESLLSNEVIFHSVKKNFQHWNCEAKQHPEVNELVGIKIRIVLMVVVSILMIKLWGKLFL